AHRGRAAHPRAAGRRSGRPRRARRNPGRVRRPGPRGRAGGDRAGMAIPDPTRVRGGHRSRPVCLAPAPALAGGPRDARHHRLSPAGGTRGSGRDSGGRFGRRDRQTARARAGGRGDPGRGARPAAVVRDHPAVSRDPGAQGSGRAASAGGVVRGAPAARAHRTGMTPMRLQRALARAGVTSRRKAEELIRAGRVRVDGQVATLGMSVDPGRQRVTVDGHAVRAGPIAWLALNKPVGFVVSRRDPEGRRTVYDLLPEVPGLTYVGRLDVMTSGLLLLTTDGAAAHRLMHPRFAVPRTYWLRAHGRLSAEIVAALGSPIAIDGRPVRVTQFRLRPAGRSVELEVTLAEGRQRIVRRLAEALGLKVEWLHRVAYGPVRLGRLREGKYRRLAADEIDAIERLHGPA